MRTAAWLYGAKAKPDFRENSPSVLRVEIGIWWGSAVKAVAIMADDEDN
ncbi:hypothetical protein [uncultured Microbulbifer sp.]|nr:hypothetical protein [uncultured Microbulbifer sp.]